MPISISKDSLYMRNPKTGEFIPVSMYNSGANETLEKIAEIAESKKTEASSAMEARKTELVESMKGDADEIKAQIVAGAEVDIEEKKNRVLEQIPDDYSELGMSVNQVKDNLNEITTKVVSKNIFFSEWTEAGQSINYTTGEDIVDNENHRTGYVEVESNTTYTMSTDFGKAPSVYVFFYDENKNFLSRYNTPYGFYPKTFTTPENTKYFRVRQGYQAMPTNFQVEKGSVATDYEEPYALKKVPYSALFGTPNLDEYVKSNNSKNIGFVWESGGLNYNTGQEVVSDAMMRTKFIEVSPNKTYSFSYQEYKKVRNVIVCYYDKNKSHLYTRQPFSYGYFPKVLTIPDDGDIAYIRMYMEESFANIDTSLSQAEENTMATSYRDADANEIPEALLPNSVCGYLCKKIIVFGDSITAIGEVPETKNSGWTSYFKASVKPSEWYNFAIGGSTWCDYENGNGNFMSMEIENMKNANIADVDCVIFASGTNDTNITVPTDAEVESAFYDSSMNKIAIDDVDRTTWQGAMRYAVDSVRYLYPHAKIFICTPIQREYQSDEPVRSLYSIIKAKNEIIKKMCARLGVECIDTEQCGITGTEAVDFVDHLHPSVNGAKKIARYNTARFMAWFNQN